MQVTEKASLVKVERKIFYLSTMETPVTMSLDRDQAGGELVQGLSSVKLTF